jgi:hypothetical protein
LPATRASLNGNIANKMFNRQLATYRVISLLQYPEYTLMKIFESLD